MPERQVQPAPAPPVEEQLIELTDALRRSEERYRCLLVATTNIVWTTNAQGEVIDDLPSWRAFTGMTPEQVGGWGWISAVHPEDREETGKVWSAAVRSRGIYTTEYRVRRRDGAYRCMSVRGVPVLEADGSLREWVGMCTDITDSREAEEQLRQASRYSRNLIEASLDPLVTIRKDGQIMDVNQATELVTGVPRGKLIGSDFCNYFTQPDEARRGYEQVFKDGFVRDYPLTIRHVSGALTEVVYNATLFRNKAGGVEGVFAAARDITERKKLEQELHAKQLYTRSLIESRIDALATIDPAGLITDVNHQMEVLTGFSRQDLIGSRFSSYFSDPQRAEEGVRLVLREGRVTNYELTARHRQGQETVVAYNASTFYDPEGRLQGVFAAARDITERRRAEQQLRNYALELARSNKDLEDFASIASHDLQEPLRKISAFGERLREHCGNRLDEAGQDCLGRMLSAAQRMGELIEGLLQYSRLSTRAQPFESVDLTTLAIQVIADLETRLHETHAQVQLMPLPTLNADPTQMRQLIQNLLSNALKFHKAGEAPRVLVSSHQQDGGCSIVVSDNGIGFDPKYADKIFRPFQRLHGRMQYEGSGMGLAICQRIVTRHGGTITAESQPEAGSRFIVWLPAPPQEVISCNQVQPQSASCSPKMMTTTTS